MNRFKELRLKHGYKSQKDLAEMLFVNQTAVSQWERGVTRPTAEMQIKLSKLYNVPVDYLLGNDAEDNIPTAVGRRDEDTELYEKIMKLSPEMQKHFEQLIDALLSQQQEQPPESYQNSHP